MAMAKMKSENLGTNNNLIDYNMITEHKLNTFKLRTRAPQYAPKMKPEHYGKLPSYEWCKYIFVDKYGEQQPYDYHKVGSGEYTKVSVDYFPHINLWKKRLNRFRQFTNCGVPCGKINDITVIDLDFYKDGQEEGNINGFNKEFGTDYAKAFDTYTVRTGSGGWHLYFKYTPKITQTQDDTTNVDTRGDGGYVVGAGTSFITSTGDEKVYTVEHDAEIKPMPEKLQQWLLSNIYKNQNQTKTKKARNKVVKVHNPITNEMVEEVEDNVDLGVYTFGLSDDEIEHIFCKSIPDMFFLDREHHVKFATAMKTLNKYDLYLKWSLKRCEQSDDFELYDGSELFLKNAWDYIKKHNQLFCVEHLAKMSRAHGSNDILKYTKYKPTECHTEKPDIQIDREKLGYGFVEEYMDDTRCIVCRSDTGTGKTTSTKHYLKNNNKRFISIVSRISLGTEQAKVFQLVGLQCQYWEDIQKDMDENNSHAYHYEEFMGWEHMEGHNIVITIDSLCKLKDWNDFYGYTLYLDEFNSLVEYFTTCGNMGNKRLAIWKVLYKIMLQCDLVVCTDADISDNCLLLLKQWNIQYKFIENQYKHNENIKATEIHEYDKFIKKMKDTPKWMCCADSKTMVDIMKKMGDDPTIKCYTSENGSEEIDLDAHDKVIFSPKVVYGLDSLMTRPVFCMYQCHTITPAAMVQQICRNRNITELFYHFTQQGKGMTPYIYHTREECKLDIETRDKYGTNLYQVIDPQMAADYSNLLSGFLYNYDCYNTNKCAHFLNILRSKGFIVKVKANKSVDGKNIGKVVEEMKMAKHSDLVNMCNTYKLETLEDMDNEEEEELMDEIKAMEYATALPFASEGDHEYLDYNERLLQELNKEKYDEKDKVMEETFPEWINRKNEILKIPPSKISKHFIMFTDPTILPKHISTCDMFFHTTGTVNEDLVKKEDFNSNKSTSDKAQVVLCRKFKQMIGLCDNFTNTPMVDGYINETAIKPLNKEQFTKFEKEYKTVFRYRGKGFSDLTDQHECIVFYAKMVDTICGEGIITRTKTTVNKKHCVKYQYNKKKLQKELQLLENRKEVDCYKQEYKVDEFWTRDYKPTLIAHKQPISNKVKQQKIDKTYVDWMKDFKSF